MDRYSKSKIAQQFNRNTGINASNEFKEQTESIALAHAVAGNMDAFMLMTNTLAKLDAESNLLKQLAENQEQTAKLTGIVGSLLSKKGKK